eukprot:1157760-Pelagomonas_calceolata.AAC.3
MHAPPAHCGHSHQARLSGTDGVGHALQASRERTAPLWQGPGGLPSRGQGWQVACCGGGLLVVVVLALRLVGDLWAHKARASKGELLVNLQLQAFRYLAALGGVPLLASVCAALEHGPQKEQGCLASAFLTWSLAARMPRLSNHPLATAQKADARAHEAHAQRLGFKDWSSHCLARAHKADQRKDGWQVAEATRQDRSNHRLALAQRGRSKGTQGT